MSESKEYLKLKLSAVNLERMTALLRVLQEQYVQGLVNLYGDGALQLFGLELEEDAFLVAPEFTVSVDDGWVLVEFVNCTPKSAYAGSVALQKIVELVEEGIDWRGDINEGGYLVAYPGDTDEWGRVKPPTVVKWYGSRGEFEAPDVMRTAGVPHENIANVLKATKFVKKRTGVGLL